MTPLKSAMPRVLRRLVGRAEGRVTYSDEHSCWEEAATQCGGYDAQHILDKVLAATLKVKSGLAAFERDSVTFDTVEYAWPLLSGLMWAAAKNEGRLNVLDFGGALGSTYFHNRMFLDSLPAMVWNVVEQPHYVEAGKRHIQDASIRFYASIQECLTENRPNLVVLSSVLQYLPNPSQLIAEIDAIGAGSLILDRTPFTVGDEDKVVVQTVPATIYQASYPMWILSKPKLENLLFRNWRRLVPLPCPEGVCQTAVGRLFTFEGMLLEAVA